MKAMLRRIADGPFWEISEFGHAKLGKVWPSAACEIPMAAAAAQMRLPAFRLTESTKQIDLLDGQNRVVLIAALSNVAWEGALKWDRALSGLSSDQVLLLSVAQGMVGSLLFDSMKTGLVSSLPERVATRTFISKADISQAREALQMKNRIPPYVFCIDRPSRTVRFKACGEATEEDITNITEFLTKR